MQVPEGIGDGVDLEQPVRALLAGQFGQAAVDPLAIDGTVDDDMGDMEPLGPNSRAMLWLIARKPALAAAKAVNCGRPRSEAEAPVKSKVPRPRAIMAPAASRPKMKPPRHATRQISNT